MRSLKNRIGQFVLDLFSTAQPPPAAVPASPPQLPVSPTGLGDTLRWGTRGGPRMASLGAIPLVFSKRMKRSWRLEHPRTRPVLHLPAQLEQAPDSVWEALGDWVTAQIRPAPGSRARAKLASRIVFEWMGEAPERVPKGSSSGRHHDLAAVFSRLNQTYFRGELQATIRWSPRPGGLSTHRQIKTASGASHLITIGQVYDQPGVPLFALEGVVHHEMLHIVHPPRSNGPLRRHVHHKAFRDAEASFPFHEAWKMWELEHMGKLIRKVRKKRR